jgi:hypothetical protein
MYGDNFLYPDRIVTRNAEGTSSTPSVLASNVSSTSVLNTFPTTSTSSSLGHYHFTESGTNALKFLNVSGSGSGGHKFYTANSTTEPVNTASIGLDGLTIDKSTSGTPPIYSPNVFELSTNGVGIFFPPGTNLTLPPYNMTQTFNPIYMTQTTSFFTTGDLVYAVLASNDCVYIFYNDNITNPIPPNVYPTNFPTAFSNVGITLGIPIFSLTLPSPSIPQIINIYEEITITTDTDTSILSATNLTFNNINVKMNQVQPTLIYSSPLIYADAQPPATSLSIRNNFAYSGWYFKNIVLGNKINWYFPPKNATSTLVSDLKGISISFFNGATTSNDDTLYITIYTRPTGSNDYFPGFFHSANTYVFDQAITPTVNTNYQGVCIINKSFVPYNYETQIQYEPSTVNNPKGNYQPTDNILAVVIGTNSASAVNSVEFVVNKLNLHYADFTQSYLLVSP